MVTKTKRTKALPVNNDEVTVNWKTLLVVLDWLLIGPSSTMQRFGWDVFAFESESSCCSLSLRREEESAVAWEVAQQMCSKVYCQQVDDTNGVILKVVSVKVLTETVFK